MSILLTRIARVRRNYDADARQYLQRVETALGTATSATRRKAVSDFVRAEKSAGRWSAMARIYLPIWGVASANAICMVTRTSGTWVGSVTHGSGFVQGDGSTGYLNMGATGAAMGMTNSLGFLAALITQADGRTGSDIHIIGGGINSGAPATALFRRGITGGMASWLHNSGAVVGGSGGTQTGIWYSGLIASNSRFIRRRTSSGVGNTGTDGITSSASGSAHNLFGLAINNAGTPVGHYAGRVGAFVTGRINSTAGADAFTLNLRTLWETTTGLTLP